MPKPSFIDRFRRAREVVVLGRAGDGDDLIRVLRSIDDTARLIDRRLERIADALEALATQPDDSRLEAEAARLKAGLDAIEQTVDDAMPASPEPRR